MNPSAISRCTQADFLQILEQVSDFWGSDRTLAFHHPMFVNEFGDTAFVIREQGRVVAYLFGFLSQTEPAGYVHLVGVRQDQQRKGLGRKLYLHFIQYLRQKGVTELKAITTPGNESSIRFHRALGMEMQGEGEPGEVPVVQDYSGKGQHRVVFKLKL